MGKLGAIHTRYGKDFGYNIKMGDIRRRLVKVKQWGNASQNIQNSRTLIYKVPEMKEKEGFLSFMRVFEAQTVRELASMLKVI